ncbi:parB domain protein nuclease [Clostridium sp. CAG:632]|nr:parB domain protein nuclease [Clostridium sp. CAG:632]
MATISNKRKTISVDELFGISSEPVTEQQEEAVRREICSLPLDKLHSKRDHRFRTELGQKNEDLLQSIKEFGVLEPIIVQPYQDGYEILSGHRRAGLAKRAGLTEIPAVIKEDLTDAEADLIETETNLYQRGWHDMSISERASVLSAHYKAVASRGTRIEFLTSISAEIKTLSNLDKIKAEDSLSQIATKGNIRDLSESYELSKDMVARYLRIHELIEELQDRLDLNEVALMAGVELSYLSNEKQKLLDKQLNSGFKMDIKKAKLLRELEAKDELTEAAMIQILSGKREKKQAGRPKKYTIRPEVINRYFPQGTKEKEVEDTIEKALELYFATEQ